jgi:methyl-accepting chemotaxis protein
MQSGIVRKIIFSYLILVFFGALGYLVVMVRFNKSNSILDDINNKHEVVVLCDKLSSHFENQTHYRRNFYLVNKKEHFYDFYSEGEKLTNLINTIHDNDIYQRIAFRNILNILMDSLKSYTADFKQSPMLIEKGMFESHLQRTTLREKKIKQLIMNLSQELDGLIRHSIQKVESNNRGTYNIAIILFLCMVLLAFYMTYSLSRTIITPLRQLLIATKFIGMGNFQETEDLKIYDNEIGELANAFIDMGKELDQYRKKLVESERLKTVAHIAASVSHEINNPLMIISGNAEYLKDMVKQSNPDFYQKLSEISTQTNRITEITQKLIKVKNIMVEPYTDGSGMIDIEKSTETPVPGHSENNGSATGN